MRVSVVCVGVVQVVVFVVNGSDLFCRPLVVGDRLSVSLFDVTVCLWLKSRTADLLWDPAKQAQQNTSLCYSHIDTHTKHTQKQLETII